MNFFMMSLEYFSFLYQYNNEFYIQLSLKGLGNVGTGNPQSLLNSINGYTSAQFGW